MTTRYADLLRRCETDPDVVGVVLSGSQARDMATEHSDFDVYVVLREDNGRWSTSRTPELDTMVFSVEDLADTSNRWQRYSYRGARVLMDRLGGRIADLVRAQATLTPAESDALVREQLDGYINFIYRAAKNRRDGRGDLAKLDEIEAAPWFLWTLFALYGRIRPYNKFLRWELDNYALPAPWTADYLIRVLTERPSALFPELERGHGRPSVVGPPLDDEVVVATMDGGAERPGKRRQPFGEGRSRAFRSQQPHVAGVVRRRDRVQFDVTVVRIDDRHNPAAPTAHDGPVEDDVTEAVEDRTRTVELDTVHGVRPVADDDVRTGVDRGVSDLPLVIANVVAGYSPVHRDDHDVHLTTQPRHIVA
jgi:Nucleotidyltransferase domain